MSADRPPRPGKAGEADREPPAGCPAKKGRPVGDCLNGKKLHRGRGLVDPPLAAVLSPGSPIARYGFSSIHHGLATTATGEQVSEARELDHAGRQRRRRRHRTVPLRAGNETGTSPSRRAPAKSTKSRRARSKTTSRSRPGKCVHQRSPGRRRRPARRPISLAHPSRGRNRRGFWRQRFRNSSSLRSCLGP